MAAERVALEMNKTNLLDLPEGAGYHSRNGRAEVSLRNEKEKIIIEANCDSLMRQYELWEEQLYESESIIDSLTRELHCARREILNEGISKKETFEKYSNTPRIVAAVLALFAIVVFEVCVVVLINRLNRSK